MGLNKEEEEMGKGEGRTSANISDRADCSGKKKIRKKSVLQRFIYDWLKIVAQTTYMIFALCIYQLSLYDHSSHIKTIIYHLPVQFSAEPYQKIAKK